MRRGAQLSRMALSAKGTARRLPPLEDGGKNAQQSRLRPAFLLLNLFPSAGGRFPSETHVKRGPRTVHGDVDLIEKLGRNDLCPCGSGRRFKRCCMRNGGFDGSERTHYF
jgi:hypothetical protein